MNIENEIDNEDSVSTYVSLAGIAEELGASRSAVRSWLASGGVEAYTFGCGRNAAIRYERDQVEAWIESCGSEFHLEAEEGDEELDEQLDEQLDEDDLEEDEDDLEDEELDDLEDEELDDLEDEELDDDSQEDDLEEDSDPDDESEGEGLDCEAA
jgi:hypothetical protein